MVHTIEAAGEDWKGKACVKGECLDAVHSASDIFSIKKILRIVL